MSEFLAGMKFPFAVLAADASSGGGDPATQPPAGAQGAATSDAPPSAAATVAAGGGTDTITGGTDEDWKMRRISELTGRFEKEKRSREQLQQQLLELQAKTVAAPPAAAAAPPAQGNGHGRAFTQEEFDQAVRQEAAARASEMTDITAFNSACDAAYHQGAEAHKDFDAKLATFRAAVTLDKPFMDQVLATGVGGKVIYELGKDPANQQRIFNLPPHQRGMELARMAIQLDAPKTPSKAPAPINGLNSGGDGTDMPLDDKRLSMEDFVARRAAQVEERRKAKRY